MENKFEIRKVEEKDIKVLGRLYDEVWPDSETNHLKKAEFVLKESTGVSYCALKGNEIVGSRTSFFMPAYFGSRKLNCVQFADSCIRKDCRRQGLFLMMNQAFLKGFFEEQPGELIYNISVDASKAAYEKLGWNYIHSLHEIRCYPNLFKTLIKVGFNLNKIKGQPRMDLDTEVCVLPKDLLEARENFMRTTENIHIEYTYDTFIWRMKSGNGIKIKEVPDLGAVVYKIGYKPSGISYLCIGEVFLYDYTFCNFKKLMKSMVSDLKPDILSAVVTLGHPLLAFYKKIGLKSKKGDSAFLNQGVRVESEEMKSICYKPENWALSMLDIDTF